MIFQRALFVVFAWIIACSQAFAGNGANAVERYRCSHILFGILGELTLETRFLDSQRVQIELAGDALGMMAVLDGNRQQHYLSILHQDNQGRFATLAHRRSTQINSRGRRIQYGWLMTFDDGGHVNAHRVWGGEVVETRLCQIPADCYGDFLSVLYVFQHHDEPLQVSHVYRYPFFALQGVGRLEVRVEDVEAQEPGASHGALWRCRITSASGCLPGNCTSLTVWCDEQRRVIKAEVPFLWGLGTVVIQKISESS
nr:hypothetical protein [uncultured Desulfuromonas sp.]